MIKSPSLLCIAPASKTASVGIPRLLGSGLPYCLSSNDSQPDSWMSVDSVHGGVSVNNTAVVITLIVDTVARVHGGRLSQVSEGLLAHRHMIGGAQTPAVPLFVCDSYCGRDLGTRD